MSSGDFAGNEATLREMLERRRAERDALLERARRVVEEDPRVAAAWLFGSHGRGTQDDLSDLDLFVVVADAQVDAVVRERTVYVAQVGEPLLLLEAPQNAPPGGAYLMALYEGEAGPHQIDWYWQGRAAARLPQETLLLFDHSDLPRVEGPPQFEYQPTPERTPLEAAAQTVRFFWVMLFITAKYAARSPHEERMGLLQYVTVPLREIEQFLGADLSVPIDEHMSHAHPREKLEIFRDLAGRMEALMPQLAARGVDVPAAIVPHAYRYLELIERIIAPK